MGIESDRIRVTTVGGAGAATATAYGRVLNGVITGVKVDYHASAPVTTTVVITEEGGMNQSILTLSASATDAIYYPTAPAHTQAGAVVGATTVRVPITLAGSSIKVVVALSDALTDAVIVTVYVMG